MIATKAEFSRLANLSKARVTQLIESGTIGADAIVGQGPKAKIRVELALAQVDARRDVGQATGNGMKTRTRLVPRTALSDDEPDAEAGEHEPNEPAIATAAVSSDVQERIAEEKLKEIERRNRVGDEEEAARRGIFTSTADATRAMNAIAGQMMRSFEGMLPEMATAVASAFKLEHRDVLHVLTQASRAARERAAERAAAKAAELPQFVDAS